MNKKLIVAAGVLLALGAPSASLAAFTFGSVSTDQLYFTTEQNSIVVTQTRTDEVAFITPPTWATCEYEAAQAGLPESSNYWCVQKAVLGSVFDNNCVFLCQIGEGGGITSTPTQPSMTTYLFSAPPVGHPLSYYTNANQGQRNAMDASLMCLSLPSLGYGCELKKYTPVNVAPTVTMSANPASILSGASSALTWSSTNTTSCSLNQSIGGVATTGTRSVSPSGTTTYTVSCTGAGGTASASATVTVTDSPWVSQGCGEITQSYNATCNKTAELLDMTCPAGSRMEAQDSYTCPIATNNNPYKSSRRCVTDATCSVSVPTAALSANPASVASGSASTLAWSSTNALMCTGTGFDTQGATSGSLSTGALSSAANYSLLCTGASGAAVPGTWQLSYTDISDLSCPVTAANRVYTGIADCPSNPKGKTCSGVGGGNVCKINTIRTGGSSGCYISTDVYQCNAGAGATPTPTARASASVAVTSSTACSVTIQAGQTASFTLTPTGYFAGQRVRYGVKWTGLGAYEYLPDNTTWYYNAPEPQVVSHVYPTVGTYNFVANAMNTDGSPTQVSINGSTYASIASCTVNVTALSRADLTAGAITPTTATVNRAVDLLATISNIGSAHSNAFRDAAVEAEGRLVGYGRNVSGNGMPVLFQIDSDTNHNSGVVNKTLGILGIASGATQNASVPHTFTTSGVWYVRACADMWEDMTGIVNESNEGNNCGPWTPIAVTGVALPDLTAGTVSPSTATEDSPVTLSSSVLNSVVAPVGAFPNIFQIENGAIISANTVPSLAMGASSVLSASYTFASAGTYRVRSCVDNNSSWVGSVAESNEGNNCGEYTSIAVNACSGPGCTGNTGTLSCTVNNANPLVGQTVTYTAIPGGGATGPYIWTPSDGVTGLGTGATASRTFPAPGPYTMRVSSATGANASCTPQVSVGCGVAAASITASPTRVNRGSTATLTIPSLSGVDGTCRVLGPGVDRTFTASGCAVPATSISTGPITTLSTYTISCDNETTAKVIVNVVPAFEEF